MHRETQTPKEHYQLLLVQSEVEEIRLNALDLFEMLGEQPPTLPEDIYAALTDDVEKVAARARTLLDMPIEEQLSLKSREKDSFVNILRNKFEAAGILVAKHPALVQFGARGICFYATPLPVVVFSNEAPGAQAFTLGHELAHVILKVSAISGAPGSATPSAKRVEDWCNAFASAFLVPSAALERLVPRLSIPLDAIEDSKLNDLARAFAVSRHAMLIRLVNLGYVRASFYWDVKRPWFLEEEAKYKARGRPKYYGSRYRTSRGDLYTGLVLEAWANGMITNHNAAEFMGIKNLAHLSAIRDQFRT
jgi:Zn-dependent peptidase ImmA (M78 family)